MDYSGSLMVHFPCESVYSCEINSQDGCTTILSFIPQMFMDLLNLLDQWFSTTGEIGKGAQIVFKKKKKAETGHHLGPRCILLLFK